jgi:hypothetical protein
MPAAYSDLYLDQGSTFSTQTTLTDLYGNTYDLTYFTVSAQAKKSYYSSNVIINFVTTVVDANNGVIQLNLDAANSALVPAGKLVYDVLIKNTSSNAITRIVEGQIFVSPGVTGVTNSYGTDV